MIPAIVAGVSLAGIALAAAFAALGALSVKVTVLTLTLQATALVAAVSILFAVWTSFSNRHR